MTKKNTPMWILLAGCVTLCATVPATFAQGPIRVQTNQVLVPVYVFDKEQDRLLWRDPSNLARAVSEGNIQLEEDIEEGLVIHDLTAADFQVFEDGKEQAIQYVAYEKSLYWDFRDNRGYHSEYIGAGGGKWSTSEWPSGLVGDVHVTHYLIAYVPPDSPEGSCHQIRVKVNRRNAIVEARREYCNTKHSASDPLNGTEFGKRMDGVLALPGDKKVDFTLLAFALFTEKDPSRVHIALDWPSKSLGRHSMTVGVLGILLKKDGSLATRFSDLYEHNSTNQDSNGVHWDDILTRYETQFNLPPGDYDLRAVLSDGTRFGRAEIPTTVDAYDRKELAISAVTLCKKIQDASAYSSPTRAKLPGTWTAKMPGNYLPLVSKDMEFKPTANTRFKKGETLYTYFEVYEPSLGGQSPATVQIQVRIVDLRTGEVKSDSQPISATPYLKEGSPVIPIGRGIDISKLPNGSYRLDVQASDSTGKSTAWRTANFTIE
jgi:hypothetical protein